MSITINKTWGYLNNEHYEVVIESGNAKIVEDDFTKEQLLITFTDLFKEALYENKIEYWEIVDKLIDLSILEKDQLYAWCEENTDGLP